MDIINIQTFGARANSADFATDAIRRAVRACAERGGGTVLVPAGVYRCTPFELESNITLYLEAGAVLLGSETLEDYPIEEGKLSQESQRAGLVTVHNAERVTITGRGVIDGSAMAFLTPGTLNGPTGNAYPQSRQGADHDPAEGMIFGPIGHGERPGNLVRFHDCRNVELSGVTIRNAPTWTVHFRACEDVNIHAVRIHSPGTANQTPNDDGIDLEGCTRVRISDCEIDTGDDCIAVFGSQSLAVSNCTLRSRSAGVRVNYDTGHARDLVFNNLVIQANRGVTMMVRGEAVTENVLFSNLVIQSRIVPGNWWGLGEPVSITALPGTANPMPPGQAPFNQNRAPFTGHIRNVRFSNIMAEGDHGIVVYASELGRIRDVSFENVRLTIRNSPYHASKGGNIDLRPAADPAQNVFAHDIPAMWARGVQDLTVRELHVRWDEGLPPYFTHALEVEQFAGLRVEGFSGRHAQPGADHAPFALRGGRGLTLEDFPKGIEPVIEDVER